MNNFETLVESAKEAAQKAVERAREFVHHEPTQAAAVAVGLVLGWHILPTRLLIRSVALAAGVLTQPVLIALGTMKAAEIYRTSQKVQASEASPELPETPSSSPAIIIVP